MYLYIFNLLLLLLSLNNISNHGVVDGVLDVKFYPTSPLPYYSVNSRCTLEFVMVMNEMMKNTPTISNLGSAVFMFQALNYGYSPNYAYRISIDSINIGGYSAPQITFDTFNSSNVSYVFQNAYTCEPFPNNVVVDPFDSQFKESIDLTIYGSFYFKVYNLTKLLAPSNNFNIVVTPSSTSSMIKMLFNPTLVNYYKENVDPVKGTIFEIDFSFKYNSSVTLGSTLPPFEITIFSFNGETQLTPIKFFINTYSGGQTPTYVKSSYYPTQPRYMYYDETSSVNSITNYLNLNTKVFGYPIQNPDIFGYTNIFGMCTYPVGGTPSNATVLSRTGRMFHNTTLTQYYLSNVYQTTGSASSFAIFIGSHIYVMFQNGQFTDLGVRPGGYRLLQFQCTTNSSLQVTMYNNSMNLGYPFGVGYGETNQFTHSSSFIVPPYISTYNDYIKMMAYVLTVNASVSFVPTLDTQPPALKDISYVLIPSQYSYLLRIRVTDNLSGVQSIKLNGVTVMSMNQTDIVSGDILDGYYEKVISQYNDHLGLVIKDNAGNSITYTYGNYIAIETQIIPFPPFIKFSPQQITYFKFMINDVDTSLGPVQNTLYINISNVPLDYRIPFAVVSGKIVRMEMNEKDFYYGDWDPKLQMFVVKFTIPPKQFNGDLKYFLSLEYYIYYEDSLLINLFGNDARVTVYSNNSDLLPPQVIASTPVNTNTTLVGWIFTVTDDSGFQNGTVTFTHNYDPKPFTLPLVRISGDQYYGNYSVIFTNEFNDMKLSMCPNFQIFRVQYFNLTDVNGITSGESVVSTLYHTPVWLVFGCTNNPPLDNTPPSLTNLVISGGNSIDSCGPTVESRSFWVNFTLVETGPVQVGISQRHLPIVYLMTYQLVLTSVESRLEYYGNTTANYSTYITIPYRTSDTFILSLYGATDRQFNTNGYSLLGTTSQEYKKAVVFNCDVPILESYTPITNKGGLITIFGKGFAVNPETFVSTFIINGNNMNLSAVMGTGIMLVYDLPSIIQPMITLQLSRVNGTSSPSNILKIYPKIIVEPTEVPTIPCTDCGSNAQCVLGTCQCNPGWEGYQCSQRIIIVPVPGANTTNPDIIFSNQTNFSDLLITSVISVVGVRELDISDNPVQEYIFRKWLYFNQSSLDNNNNNITTYTYQTNVTQDCKLTVTIQYFNSASTIVYIDSLVKMDAGALKYSIDISPYPFQKRLNRLEVMIQASLADESTVDQTCVTQSTKFNSNFQMVKMNINNVTLYSRFIQKARVDYKTVKVNTRVINSTINNSNKQATTLMGVYIPYYSLSSFIDPDFYILVGHNDDQDGCDSSPSDLPNKRLLIIAVSCSVGGACIVVALIYYLYRKREFIKSHALLQFKLKQLNPTKVK